MVARIPTTVHNGSTYLSSYDTISDNVVGLGSYIVISPTPLTFLHSVGSGQTIVLNGNLRNGTFTHSDLYLADPADFHGHVDMTGGAFVPKAPMNLEQTAVGMSMLGRAVDSYSYHNDMLSLWYGNRVVQQLSLTVHDPYGITVQASKGAEIWVSLNVAREPGGGMPYPGQDVFHGIPLSYPSDIRGGIMPVHGAIA